MSSRDYSRIDEVYHNMYKNKFHREEPFDSEDYEAMGEDAEYAEKAKKHTPEAAKVIMHKLKLSYGDKFNPEKAKAAVKRALGSTTEEDFEGWAQDESHTPEQKKEMVKYVDDEAAEESDDHKVYDMAKFEIERAGNKVAHCLTRFEDSAFDSKPVNVRATPEKAEFEIMSEGTKYKITVELAK
jgi:hypothetical protein